MKKMIFLLLLAIPFSLAALNLIDLMKDGKFDKIEDAVKDGADVNVRDKNGWTPIMYSSAYFHDAEITRLFINAGADIDARNLKGATSLMIAAWNNTNTSVIT